VEDDSFAFSTATQQCFLSHATKNANLKVYLVYSMCWVSGLIALVAWIGNHISLPKMLGQAGTMHQIASFQKRLTLIVMLLLFSVAVQTLSVVLKVTELQETQGTAPLVFNIIITLAVKSQGFSNAIVYIGLSRRWRQKCFVLCCPNPDIPSPDLHPLIVRGN